MALPPKTPLQSALGTQVDSEKVEDFLAIWLSELIQEDCPVKLIFQSNAYGDLTLSFDRLSALTGAMQKPRSKT